MVMGVNCKHDHRVGAPLRAVVYRLAHIDPTKEIPAEFQDMEKQ